MPPVRPLPAAMENRLNKSLAAVVLAASVVASSPASRAEPTSWPTRPVTVICPFAAGISTDLLTRAVAVALADKLGQQLVVENRPGATGNIGAAAAAKAAPDGYTLLVTTLGPSVTNKLMYKSIGYDPERTFAPIVLLGSSPLTIVGSPRLPVTDLRELIAYAKSNPGKLNAGTVGTGSQAHITLELINKLAGISIGHVPYRVGTQALPDLISGDLQVGFNYIPTFVPAVQAGTIRGLAVTSLERTRDLPDVPTVQESGFPGFEATGWNALVAPAGTPREIINKVNAVVNAFLASDAGRQQLEKMGMTAIGGTPEALKAHLERETAKWGPIVRDANISLQ
jgi:tripartite-type tricarboxylate transporter receptor subunit TctC